ncbi:MAG: sugar phosphate isomerase/epimerase family protein [Candidatus Hinthialibacter antarcticus]|nr:sugar phosphate isomerase/epimerase family protein [Candidatus Hinthialibacter antarcticus]
MNVFGFNVYGRPVEDCFDYALQHSIRHLEIDLNAAHSQLHTFTLPRIELLNQFSQQTGIRYSFHADVDMNLAGNYFLRKPHIQDAKQCLEIAHQINAAHITCHLGHFSALKPWSWRRKQMLEQAARSIEKILRGFANSSVVLALENAPSISGEREVHHLGDCLDDFEYLFGVIQSDQVGMCLDVGHANTNDGVLAFLKQFGSRISAIHFHDNNGENDEHLCVCDGSVPWLDFAVEFKKQNQQTPCISECFKVEPHVAIGRLKAIFSEAATPNP